MRIDYESLTLENGLRVLVHTDRNTSLVAFNLIYDVGSKDESPERTGLAHLFEHLMFSGSKHVPDYDAALDRVGASNNAFTNNDFTNYYISLPKEALETAFFVESDRMRNLVISQKKLDVQKGVVVEEFKERCLNRPYADTDLLIRPLSYKKHPYAWSTIGKDTGQIEAVTLEEARAFYDAYYMPGNAILSVAGPVASEEIFDMARKWFGPVESGRRPCRSLPQEPEQDAQRREQVERKVPADAFYRAYHMGPRMSPGFYVFDLLSDILSSGDSSRFHTRLVKGKKLFSSLNAYVSGDIEPGLFLISGMLEDGVDFAAAEEAVDAEIACICEEMVTERELQKVKNKLETSLVFSNMKALDKAMNIGYFELMGAASALSGEVARYRAVDAAGMLAQASRFLRKENSSTLYYKAIK